MNRLLTSYYEFVTGIEKNYESIKKGVQKYHEFANEIKILNLELAATYNKEANTILAAVKTEAKRLEEIYPKDLSFSTKARATAQAHFSHASYLYDATEYGKAMIIGYRTSDRGVFLLMHLLG